VITEYETKKGKVTVITTFKKIIDDCYKIEGCTKNS